MKKEISQAELINTIPFDGFAANEIYPADINGDGKLELLCLQSAGIYQSKVFIGTSWVKTEDVPCMDIFCLTAITREGKILWQFGKPCLKFKSALSHVADQMLWCGIIADKDKPEIAVIKGKNLLILDAATGTVKRSKDLSADNFGIVLTFKTRHGNRLLVQNTEASYEAAGKSDDPSYKYALPARIYDAGDLSLIATIDDNCSGSGHSPRVLDIDGDGDDEILIGFDAYDSDGKKFWRLEGERRQPITLYHVDQLQIGKFGNPPVTTVVYAASGNVEAGTLDGKLLWQRDVGHAQHVVLGDFRLGDKRACMAIYACSGRGGLGTAQKELLERVGVRMASGSDEIGSGNIVFLNEKGEIQSIIFAKDHFHSGEGILVYPQGCPDGSDAVITRDLQAGERTWPQALNMAGESPFEIPQPEIKEQAKDGPAGCNTDDGYGVRIADFDNDGRAEILIHDQTTAWIFKPPFPKAGRKNTHEKLEPVTGQGWYGL